MGLDGWIVYFPFSGGGRWEVSLFTSVFHCVHARFLRGCFGWAWSAHSRCHPSSSHLLNACPRKTQLVYMKKLSS